MTLNLPPSRLESALVSRINFEDEQYSIDSFNQQVKKLIESTYKEFPNGCPFSECRKDCILYRPTERTTHSVFCWFLTEIGQRTVLDLESEDSPRIYR